MRGPLLGFLVGMAEFIIRVIFDVGSGRLALLGGVVPTWTRRSWFWILCRVKARMPICVGMTMGEGWRGRFGDVREVDGILLSGYK